MTALNASIIPLAVRVKNTRYDGLVTGYLHGGVKFTKTDPGGFRSASFTVSQRLGFRSDMIQPYSRIYIYNKLNGDTVFEGDVSHPGRSVSDSGELLEVLVEGGVERLNDWAGARIYVDREMTSWIRRDQDTVTAGSINAGEDRGGSGEDALTLGLPTDLTAKPNDRVNAGYWRIREAGQQIGRINYSWDGGHNAVSWLVRLLVTPPSTVVRSQPLQVAGAGGSGAVVGGGIPVGANVAYLQLIWDGAANTSTGTLDTVWVSILDPVIVARMKLKDGTYKTGGYTDGVRAYEVWEDMLGDMLASTFDGPNAQIATGSAYVIQQLAFPDGVTPMQVADELMKYEPSCTYIVGPSYPGTDKYTLKWMTRTNDVRYEFITWTDNYSAGAQPVAQYNVAVSRWRTPSGLARFTTTVQSIPEMTAADRTRRFFQDLGEETSNHSNALVANATALDEHRFPQNGGNITVSREVVDLYTGRRVQPYEIEPGYMCRIVGINPSRDALNNNPRNGSTLCRIVSTDYDADSHSVSIDLDSVPWSMYRAIAAARKTKPTPQRRGR
jgi:hypothetical protein